MKAREQFVFAISPFPLPADILQSLPGNEADDIEFGAADRSLTALAAQRFASHGNSAEVQQHWRRYASLVRNGAKPRYADLSPTPAAAGLAENIGLFCEDAEVEFLFPDVRLADAARHMLTTGHTTPVDWTSSRNIVPTAPFRALGDYGELFWQIVEMQARAAFYSRNLGGLANLSFRRITLVPEKRTGLSPARESVLNETARRVDIDPTLFADRYISRRRWLG